MDRRSMLRMGGFGLAGLGLAGCASAGPHAGVGLARPARRLEPVRAGWDRVIRTTVGLRPYRPSGFVLRRERLGDKLLIHNYGHGGAGMSLSWGTGRLATEMALARPERRAAVIGCGVAGLTAARQLQRHGFDVAVYAEHVPPNTTSNMSLASWTPTSGLVDQERRSAEWDLQFRSAARMAWGELQLLVGRGYGVSWIEGYSLRATPPSEEVADTDPLLPADLRSGSTVFGPGEHPFPTQYAVMRPSMRIEPSIYLDRLVSVLATLFSGFGVVVELIKEARPYAQMEEVTPLLSLYGYALVPVGVYVFLNPRIPQKYNPFAVAAILMAGFVSVGSLGADGVGTSIWPLIFGSEVFHWQDSLSATLSLSGNVIVTLTCIAALIWGSGGRESMRNQKVQFGIRIMALVGLLGIAPCMLGVLVVMVGYLTNDRLILIAGILYIPTTLFFATHTLAIGLMSGGVILVIMACLLFVGYLLSRSWFSGPDLKGAAR